MKRELEYFLVEGQYGGNQNLFKNFFMRMGGCGAVTACDSFIYFSKYKNMKKLYPHGDSDISFDEYERFSNKIRPYLSPRLFGINKLDIYVDGVSDYLREIGEEKLRAEEFSGNNTFESARESVKEQLDKEMPIPMLVLRHKNPKYKDYVWHWFILAGYSEENGKFLVKAVTSGGYRWLNFEELWDNGYSKKGGLVFFKCV